MKLNARSFLRRVWGPALWLTLALTACTEEADLPGEPFRLSTQSLPEAVQGEAYREAVVASGGLRPVRFELSSGSLPPGIDLQNGLLVGAPETVGTFAFTVTASDANLASTFREYRLTVTDVPVPTLDVALPTTEIRGTVTVPVRLENARDVRGVRLRLTWPEGTASVQEDSVQAERSDAVLLTETQPGQLAADVAALGDPWSGDRTLLRFDVETSSAATVQMDVTAEILYGDRTEIVTRAVGTPPENDGDANEGDPEGDVTEDEANEEEAPGSETPSGDADTPEESP
jgi:hypothetical protein